MGMDRGADYPIDAVGRGRLNRKLPTSCLEEHSELIRGRSDARHLISQPSFEPRGVSDGRFPESKQGPDLGPMTLPGPTCRIVLAVMVGLHAELSSYPGQSLGIDFHRPLGEPPICPVKQEQHGEPEAVPAIFDHNERMICRGQRPRLGSGAVIEHFSESMRRGGRSNRAKMYGKGEFPKAIFSLIE
jgi:hypothetical protein